MGEHPWTRRGFLSQAGALMCAATGLRGAPALARSPGPLKGPRYFVVVFLRGGMDGVYTVDPKLRSQVSPGVDVPYSANEIIDTGSLIFGPHFKGLKDWASQMSVVHGVQVKTANHETGAEQMLRLRTGVSPNMPSILDIIGQHREQPLASVTIGKTSSAESTAGTLGGSTTENKRTVLDLADKLTPDEAHLLSKVYDSHLQKVPAWQSSDDAQHTRDHLRQASAFFDRLRTAPVFEPTRWSERSKRQAIAKDFQRTLWMLENDMTRTVYLKVFLDWDSHFANANKQTGATKTFTFLLDRFLSELDSRSNQFGRLSEQTAIVMGSELGRFPIINSNLGKDHFPEAPYLFMGPGFSKGHTFGATGTMMEGLKVSLSTGQPDKAGSHLALDDIGTTLLHMAGVNPRVYGYRGRRLRFIERA